MKKSSTVFFIALLSAACMLGAALFLFRDRSGKEWRDRTVLRMEIPYERFHPTALTAEYFSGLVKEKSGGTLEISIIYNPEPGSEKEIVSQLQFGGIALATVNFFDLCEKMPYMNTFLDTYASPDLAQDGFTEKGELIQEYLSRERLEILSYYKPDFRCVATRKQPERPGDFTGMKLHAQKAASLSLYLLGLGADLEHYDRTNLLRAIDSGLVDGSEMPLLLYGRMGYDSAMPYVWVYEEFFVPDVLVASTVSLLNLTDEQRTVLADSARETMQYQADALGEAHRGQGIR